MLYYLKTAGMNKAEKLEQLKKEIEHYLPALRQARDTILDKDVSEYPIFVFHQQTVEIGIPIIKREQVKGNWSVNASTLEEFVAKSLVQEEKVEQLKERYQDAELNYCLFVLSELGAQFIFLPAPLDLE